MIRLTARVPRLRRGRAGADLGQTCAQDGPLLSEPDALIDDLTVDAYNDEEQLAGFLVGADEALQGGGPRQSSVS